MPNIPLTNDEHSMIFAQNFGIRFDMKGAGSAPRNDWPSILTCTAQMFFSCIFAMLACILPFPWSTICGVCVGLILFFRFLTVILFMWAVIAGKYMKKFYRASVVFWGWWPMWLCLVCVLSAFTGMSVGNYLWSQCLHPYYELMKLQMYKEVNPGSVPGVRVQDAGLVDFTNFVSTDRGKGGCYMARGNTYCIAPIVYGGKVGYGVHNTPLSGSFDYFAVGVNCCTCPNRDFKCGEWNNPLANGGIRSLDEMARPFYNLALDDWQASYGKTSKHPLFFDWTQDPEWKWKAMWNRFLYCSWMAVAFALSIGMSVGFLLDKFLQGLWQHNIIAPRCCIAPAPVCEIATMFLMPRMYFRYQQEQTDIAAMPVFSAQHRQTRGPGEPRDVSKLAKDYGPLGMGGMYGGTLGSSLTGSAMASVMAPAGATTAPGLGAGASFY